LHLARRLGERRSFVATAQAIDDEMRQRIDRHRIERGEDFTTIEEPVDVPSTLAAISDADVVVVDCLTLWLSNLLVRNETEDRIEQRLDALIAAARAAPFHVVFVSNEVGMGVVPESKLGRSFCDVSGHAHQRLGDAMDEIYVGILGTILRLKPGPVEIANSRVPA
jgi:adenosylcobinamide kinase/adenosylcobinamide-phosphate guanylyltransferase